VRLDFWATFTQLTGDETFATGLVDQLLIMLRKDEHLEQIEQAVFERLGVTYAEYRGQQENLLTILHDMLAHRAEIIFEQLEPHLREYRGEKALDYGAGDGQVTQMLHDYLGLNIEGCDVRPYVAEGVTVPIHLLNDKRLDVPDGRYQVGVMTNVAHHEAENERILEDLTRLVTDKLVVIETVPVGETEEEIERDRERTFMNDYLYNRLFHRANVPVPGTYETPQGWIDRFAQHGWKCTHSEDLGVDQPTICDTHHLFVFERIQ